MVGLAPARGPSTIAASLPFSEAIAQLPAPMIDRNIPRIDPARRRRRWLGSLLSLLFPPPPGPFFHHARQARLSKRPAAATIAHHGRGTQPPALFHRRSLTLRRLPVHTSTDTSLPDPLLLRDCLTCRCAFFFLLLHHLFFIFLPFPAASLTHRHACPPVPLGCLHCPPAQPVAHHTYNTTLLLLGDFRRHCRTPWQRPRENTFSLV